MKMTKKAQLDALSLIRLLSEDFVSPWTDEDGAAALTHQLQAPLLPDLAIVPDLNHADLEDFLQSYAGPKTFGAQLLCNTPSLRLLTAIKLFAKHTSLNIANPLSRNAAKVLYFSAIAAALVHCRQRMTQLTDDALREGLRWAKGHAGSQPLQLLIETALVQLSDKPSRAW